VIRKSERPATPATKAVNNRKITGVFFALCSVLENRSVYPELLLKCKLLLHLGNSIAFSVDNKLCLTYDFD
jgi:hypothetical protein